MNKNTILVTALVLLVGFIGLLYTRYSSGSNGDVVLQQEAQNNIVQSESVETDPITQVESKDTEKATQKDDDSEVNSSTEAVEEIQPGEYIEYYDGAIGQTAGTKILFFHADWCIQCKRLEDDIIASGLPAGVTIFEVDFDSRQDLRSQYSVTLQTTLVRVDDNGNELASYGAYSNPDIQTVLDNLL